MSGNFLLLPCAFFQRCVQKLPNCFYPLKTQVTLFRGVFKNCQIFWTLLPSNISRGAFKKRCFPRGVLNTPLEMLLQKLFRTFPNLCLKKRHRSVKWSLSCFSWMPWHFAFAGLAYILPRLGPWIEKGSFAVLIGWSMAQFFPLALRQSLYTLWRDAKCTYSLLIPAKKRYPRAYLPDSIPSTAPGKSINKGNPRREEQKQEIEMKVPSLVYGTPRYTEQAKKRRGGRGGGCAPLRPTCSVSLSLFP